MFTPSTLSIPTSSLKQRSSASASVGIQLTVSSSFNVYILVLFGIVETSRLVSTNSIAAWKYRPITSLVWRNKRFKMLINDQTNNETGKFLRWWSSIGLHKKSRVEQSSKDDDFFLSLSYTHVLCLITLLKCVSAAQSDSSAAELVWRDWLSECVKSSSALRTNVHTKGYQISNSESSSKYIWLYLPCLWCGTSIE